MTTSSCASLAVAATTLMMLTLQAGGHIFHTSPVSRQYSRTLDFVPWNEDYEKLAFAYNAGGPDEVVARSQRLVDPDVLADHGDGFFPLYYAPLAPNGNYEESNELAKRHGVCGDPVKSPVGDPTEFVKYSTENTNWPVIDSYVKGQVLEVNVVMVYYHAGHLEFSICDIQDLDDPDGVPTQECFNLHPLTRAADDGGASPIDPNYPGRYYVDPPCRYDELPKLEEKEMYVPDGSYPFKARYQLPDDLECEHCILQMHLFTGSRCMHIGYEEFNPASWPSSCAPSKEDWITTKDTVCGTWPAYPEEFWQCSDISILSDGAEPATPQTDDYEETDGAAMTSDDPVEGPVCSGTSNNGGMRCEHLGCFQDNKDDRVLGDMLASDEMTIDYCFDYCADLGARYMATQWGVECWCSNDESEALDQGRHGDDAICLHQCSGNEEENCGGYDSFNLFELVEV